MRQVFLRRLPIVAALLVTLGSYREAIAQIPLQSWTYNASGGANDPAATDGKALVLSPTGQTGSNVDYLWRLHGCPLGHYRLTVRAKTASTTANGFLTVNGSVFNSNTGGSTQAFYQNLFPASFSGNNVYTTFTSEFDITARYWLLTGVTNGIAGQTSIDSITIDQLSAAPDPDTPLQQWHIAQNQIADPGSASGFATAGNITTSLLNLPLGRYRARFHQKLVNAQSDTAWAQTLLIGSNTLGAVYAPLPSSYTLGSYSDVWVPFLVTDVGPTRIETSFTGPNGWFSSNDIYTDSIDVQLVQSYTEQQSLTNQGYTRPSISRTSQGGLKMWLIEGLFAQENGILPALTSLNATVTRSWLNSDNQDNVSLQGAALSASGLSAQDVVILNDVPLSALSLPNRALLQDFVKSGGALFVIGGMYGLDRSGYGYSDLLAPLLPLNISQGATFAPMNGNVQVLNTQFTSNLSGSTFWGHTTTAKGGATVHLSNGTSPMLATWKPAGQGKVAVLAIPAYGPTGQGGFWESAAWPGTMQSLLSWLNAP